jgi:hypothetical protein
MLREEIHRRLTHGRQAGLMVAENASAILRARDWSDLLSSLKFFGQELASGKPPPLPSYKPGFSKEEMLILKTLLPKERFDELQQFLLKRPLLQNTGPRRQGMTNRSKRKKK